MASKRWSFSRVWGNPRQSTPTSGSATAASPNRGRADQPGNSVQSNRSYPAPRAPATSSSQPRRTQRASREEQAQAQTPLSTPTVPDSLWFASDFMLGAGMVIIQPSTGKVVVLSDKEKLKDGREFCYWFLPKGRKDIGESLEQTALREAYEESGLRVSFLPIILQHNAPGTPGTLADLDRAHALPCREAIYVSTQSYEKRRGTKGDAEYLTFWYVGQVPENAVVESGTRMVDEVNYETHFLSIDEALALLFGVQKNIMKVAYRVWQDTLELQSQSVYKEYVADLHVAADSAARAAKRKASSGARASPSQERLVVTTQAEQDPESWEDED